MAWGPLRRHTPLPMPIGVLVTNLGSPAAPDTRAVRRYLRQFLSDPRVIDLAAPARAALLNLVILPFRAPRSAAAYRKIWTEEGSPLLLHGRALCAGLAGKLPGCAVELGMRYGEPSLAQALGRLRGAGCDELVVFPLYPQYAASSTGSTLEEVYRLAGRLWNTPFLRVVPPFYDDPGFLSAWARRAQPILAEFEPEHVLLSFHGLPERQIQKSDESALGHCLTRADCCERLGAANRNCYRAQCFATARGIATRLALDPLRTTVCFQSRLGRTPWIQPYTDRVLAQLAARGTRRVAVLCPAFVADCLETLEEIGLRARDDFCAAGGGELRLVPSLNAGQDWIEAAAELVRRQLGPHAGGAA